MRKLMASVYFFFRYHLWIASFGLAILLAAGFLGLLGPALWAWQPQDIRQALALLSLVALPPLLAALTGARSFTTAEALQNQRFLESLGLSPAHLWWGAWGASLILAFLSSVVGALPAFRLALRELPRSPWDYLFFAVSVVALWALGHLLTLMLRARTLWLAADLVGAALASWSWYTLWQRIQNRVGMEAVLPVAVVVLSAATIILLLTSFLTLSKARTHLPAAHRVATLGLWPSLIALAVVFLGVMTYLEARAPYHLRWVSITTPDPTGRYWFGSGEAFGQLKLRSTFLWDRETNTRRHLPVEQAMDFFYLLPPYLSFSPEGTKLAYLDGETHARLLLVELSSGAQQTISGLQPDSTLCALGPHGQTAVVREPGGSLVLLNPQTLGRKTLFAGSKNPRAFWTCRATNSFLEVLGGEWQGPESKEGERRLRLAAWRLPWSNLTPQELFSLQFAGPYRYASAQIGEDRMLLTLRVADPFDPSRRSTIVYVRQGQTLWQHDLPGGATAYLADPGVVLIRVTDDGGTARWVDDSGTTLAETTLPLKSGTRCEAWKAAEAQFVLACHTVPLKTHFFLWNPGQNQIQPLTQTDTYATGYWRSWVRYQFLSEWPFPTLHGQPTFKAEGALFALDPSSGQIQKLLP